MYNRRLPTTYSQKDSKAPKGVLVATGVGPAMDLWVAASATLREEYWGSSPARQIRLGLQTPLVGSWAGVGVSFAVNDLYDTNWCCARIGTADSRCSVRWG